MGLCLDMELKIGGKMISEYYKDQPSSNFYYIYYYDEKSNMKTAISKIDETNLNKIASDLNIDYVQMSKTSNIDYKISNIKKQISDSLNNQDKINSYKDIYYYFAVPLVILIILDFILKMRRM